MSASFRVEASSGSYEVVVAVGAFEETPGSVGDGLVIADEFFRGRFAGLGVEPIFIEATEEAKSLDRMPGVIEALRGRGANRTTRLISVGGGVIQDISAFVASVYMRGVRWSYDPTTVLGMVDSCIGGKSSINVGPYKNLIGTFHPPELILIDPALAETLPRDQFASGLIEAAKICFVRGAEAFERHVGYGPSTTMSTAALEQVIVNSLLAKKHFIEIDEFDKKERLLLNFGHTFGHAIEGASHYGIPHGIAVGLGILCSLEFQRGRGVGYEGVTSVGMLEGHLREMIGMSPGVSERMARLEMEDVMERFESDKKHTGGEFTVIVVDAGGAVVMERVEKSAEMRGRVRRAVEGVVEGMRGVTAGCV